MNIGRLLACQFRWMTDQMTAVLDGLTVAELKKRPAPGANPIGWLCWHTTRSCDRLLGDAFPGEQLWISGSWHEKFDRPADFDDTGVGHSDAQVDGLVITSPGVLLAYHGAVMDKLLPRLEAVTEADLDELCRNSHEPEKPQPLARRLVGALNNLQHVGQAHYARGIVKGHRWTGN
jgi:hypothetical protein